MKQHEKTIDGTRLLTISNYAKKVGITRQAIHYQLKRGELDHVVIDGVTFIKR